MPQTPDARRQLMPLSRRFYGYISLVLVGLGFLLLVLVVLAALWMADEMRQQNEAVTRSQEVIATTNRVLGLVERAESGRRGYLLSGVERMAGISAEAQRDIAEPLQTIKVRFYGPDRAEDFRRIEALIAEQFANIDRTIALARDGRREEAIRSFVTDENRSTRVELRAIFEALIAEEMNARAARSAEASRVTRNFLLTTFLAVIVIVLLAAAFLILVYRNMRDLSASRSELERLNEGLEEAVAERTADLTAANEEIQRFAYIVSHDLRSPLVNIMGFTSELESGLAPVRDSLARAGEAAPGSVAEEARETVEVDWPEAIGFIRRATDKMDRLINAILKLSREGRRVFTPQHLDMSEILGGIAEATRHQADEAGAEIKIGRLPTIIGDRVAVEQVFGNLIDNAVKYSAPDRPGRVEVSARDFGRMVEFAVTDNGRGIDPSDRERIFDLFRRAGVQDRPGEGIGLAHVRALVRRMGGTISCASEPGAGTEFRVLLPKILKHEARGTS